MKNPTQFLAASAVALVMIFSASSCQKNFTLVDGPWTPENITTDSISFIVMGDWGKQGALSQKPVADQMHIASKKFNAQFVITTGDNFYPTGVSSVTDGHWITSFENIYNKEGHQLPWYPVLGNHDYQSDPQAQLEYSSRSNRWTLPARYHSFGKKLNDSSSVLFVFSDTSPFVEEYYGRTNMPDIKKQDTAAQYKWLKETLSASTDEWKIVVGHHPVYSAGRHGHTPEMINRFRPLFNQTGTDFYLAGHDHSLQHIYVPTDSAQYLVSGAGAEGTSVESLGYCLFAKATPGFMVMTLYPKRANIYFYNQRGDLLYRKQVIR